LKYLSAKLLSIVCGLMLITSLLLTSVFYECFNTDLYDELYTSLNRAEEIGMSHTDLMMVNANLLDYIMDKRENLNMTAQIKGQEREVFNDKEKEHMVDVKQLYLNAEKLRDILIVTSLLLIAIIFIIRRKISLYTVASGYMIASFVFLIVIALLAAYALLNFNQFWLQFHELLFKNNLWLLDPNTDILIQMVPGEFFYALVKAIFITFAKWFGTSFLAAWLMKRLGKLVML